MWHITRQIVHVHLILIILDMVKPSHVGVFQSLHMYVDFAEHSGWLTSFHTVLNKVSVQPSGPNGFRGTPLHGYCCVCDIVNNQHSGLTGDGWEEIAEVIDMKISILGCHAWSQIPLPLPVAGMPLVSISYPMRPTSSPSILVFWIIFNSHSNPLTDLIS